MWWGLVSYKTMIPYHERHQDYSAAAVVDVDLEPKYSSN